jgi:hypothetical protein
VVDVLLHRNETQIVDTIVVLVSVIVVDGQAIWDVATSDKPNESMHEAAKSSGAV